MRREDFARCAPPVRSLMLVTHQMPLAAVSRRAMGRPAACRFDPLVCCDDAGRYAGHIRVERMVDALAALAAE